MPMNLVIQKRRKELGLTQEQIAEYLNVSIPAVSKWESGQTSPDLALLPPLARLLRIDLNTLFCFQEDMTPEEIGYFCKEVETAAREKGLAEGFAMAQQKLHDYPHSEALLYQLTFLLDGLCLMSALPSEEEMNIYEQTLTAWYRRLSESSDVKISISANFMLASRCIRREDYDQAQKILDGMPDREDMISSMTDKLMLQVLIYQHQGRPEQAAKSLQNALLTTLGKAQTLLYKLIDAELACGKGENARDIADRSSRMAELFDLWEYDACLGPFQVATAEKDAQKCIRLLERMLKALQSPWDLSRTLLFSRIAKSSEPAKMLPAILSDLETNPNYAFLAGHEEFQALLKKYRAS